MSTSTGLTIINGAVTNLSDYFTTALPILIPVVIGVSVLFGGIYLLKGLWHKHI